MEKKVDTCSPNGVLEDFFRSENFETNSANKQNSKQGFRWRGFEKMFRSKSKKSLANLQRFGSFRLSSMRRSSSMGENVGVAPDFLGHSNISYNLKSSRKVFTLSELQIATKNFTSG